MLLTALLPSWKLALDAASKSPRTIISYLDSAKRLEAYPAAEGLPLEPPGIRACLLTPRHRPRAGNE
jgi:hypothetical protein